MFTLLLYHIQNMEKISLL